MCLKTVRKRVLNQPFSSINEKQKMDSIPYVTYDSEI